MLKKLPHLMFLAIVLQFAAANGVYASDRGTTDRLSRGTYGTSDKATVSHKKTFVRSSRAYRVNKSHRVDKSYRVKRAHAAHFSGTQYSQKQNDKLRSRGDVIREIKRRHNCEILKVSLDERKQLYRVRVLMPNGKVRNLKISARR